MRLDPNPLFRRIIMPWYDSPPMCWGLLAIMVIFFLFSMAGVVVASETPAFYPHRWVPWLLCALTLTVGCSVAIRLIRRHHQHKDSEP